MKSKILIDDITECKYVVTGTSFHAIESWMMSANYVNLHWLRWSLSMNYDVSCLSIIRQ
jgi:hypothetical protein